MVGQRIGQYQIVSILGEGGMGTVYEARNETIDRQVAIKVMAAGHGHPPELTVRFFNEARACNQIGHPGLVQVFDVGQLPNGSLYLVMELLKGETLEKRLRSSGRIAERRTLGLLRQLASALKAVHEKQIVHRDIKPSNIMLVPDPDMPHGERIKLLDFGIAKMQAPQGATLTKTGQTIGTALYMAPEQCRGLADVDAKADIYALGVVAFEMLAGHPPFQAQEALALLNMHVNQAPPNLRQQAAGVTDATADLVALMLSKGREERPSAAMLLDQIERLLSGVGGQSPSTDAALGTRVWTRAAPGIALLLLLIAGTFQYAWRAARSPSALRNPALNVGLDAGSQPSPSAVREHTIGPVDAGAVHAAQPETAPPQRTSTVSSQKSKSGNQPSGVTGSPPKRKLLPGAGRSVE